MNTLGTVTPGFHQGDEVRMWKVPVAVMDSNGNELPIEAIYEDEGVLCIDLKTRGDE